jgi:hypothetical protein
VRRSLALLSFSIAAGVLAACDRSSTAPVPCVGTATTASFVEGETATGVVTFVNFTAGSSPVEMLAVAIPGDPDFTIAFSISASTAVFERSGGALPATVSACHLAVGQRVQLPTSILASGFRDYIPISGNDPAPPVPPAIDQIVIVT